MSPAADTTGILLDQLDALDRELAAIRAAPAPLEAQLLEARAEFEAAARLFRMAPWSARAGIRGALAVLLPKETARFELDQIRQRVAADPREPLDDAPRHQRITAAEAELQKLLAGLGPDDLAALEQVRDAAHARLRGLTQRRDEIGARCDRLANAIALQADEREQRVRAARPRVRTWRPGDEHPLAPATIAERADADEAAAWQVTEDAAALDRERAALAAIEADCQQAAQRWRQAADLAQRCERWLRRKPVNQASTSQPLAAE